MPLRKSALKVIPMIRLTFFTIATACIILFAASPVIPQAPNTSSEPQGALVLNEISPWPSDGVVWVEIINPHSDPISIAGWTIIFLSGYSFEFPDDAPTIQSGGLHVLSISTGDQVNAAGDGCILRGHGGPMDIVVWGSPPAGSEIPLPFGTPVVRTRGYIPEGGTRERTDDVILRIPGTSGTGSEYWIQRGASSGSRGETNPLPVAERLSPEDGASFASDFTLYATGLNWATEITFQVATDEQFTDVVLEETTENFSLYMSDLDPRTYYWRVRGNLDDSGQWSETREFTREPFDIDDMIAADGIESQSGDSDYRLAQSKGGGNSNWLILTHHVIPCTHIYQNKDSGMVCINGCPMNGHCRWCTTHGMATDCKHGDCYCTRASLAMLAQTGGCTLSQDRITYYLFEEAGTAAEAASEAGHIGDPYFDVGKHGEGTSEADCRLALAWIYNQPVTAVRSATWTSQIFDDCDRSDMDSIREFILDNRALLRHSDDHSTLVAGCAILLDRDGNEVPFIKVFDPGSPNNKGWVRFDSEPSEYKEFTFPPTTGAPMRNDELELYIDSDQDGLIDFDEEQRFGTDPDNRDSDDDGIEDMTDILGYVFLPDGTYREREPDIDGDGWWKELDPDNDQGDNLGVTDGCEDANHNGFFDADGTESDNFAASDDFTFINPDCYTGYIRDEYIYDVPFPEGHLWFNWREQIVIEKGASLNSDEYIHEDQWRWMVNIIYDNGATVSGSNSGTLLAKAKLVVDPNDPTGDAILVTDVQPRNVTTEITTEAPWIPLYITTLVPQYYLFSADIGNLEWPVGSPMPTDEGTCYIGFWEPFLEAGMPVTPGCTNEVEWEIWVERSD